MAERIVSGIPEAIANLKKYQLIKTQAVKDRLKKQAFKVELAAKEMAPVSPHGGRLRASITTNWAGSIFNRASVKNPCKKSENPTMPDDGIGKPDGLSELLYVVGTNVFYALYQEHGTSKMPARPFLYPAYFMYEGGTILALAKIMKEDVKLV